MEVDDRASILGAMGVREGLNVAMFTIGQALDPCISALGLARVDGAATRIINRGTPVALGIKAFDRSAGIGWVGTRASANVHRDSVVAFCG